MHLDPSVFASSLAHTNTHVSHTTRAHPTRYAAMQQRLQQHGDNQQQSYTPQSTEAAATVFSEADPDQPELPPLVSW